MVMLLFAATLTTMISCKKSSDETSIVGKWQVTHDVDAPPGHFDDPYYSDHHIGEIWVFEKDVVRYRGNTYTYTISGNHLLIAGGAIDYNIKELTHSSLKILRQDTGETWYYEFKKTN